MISWTQVLLGQWLAVTTVAFRFNFPSSSIFLGESLDTQSELSQLSSDRELWDSVPSAELTTAEGNLINRFKYLAERPSSPDCFKRSVSLIKTKCGEEFEPDEGARIHLAISMTICELQTAAHVAIPLECSVFSGQPAYYQSKHSSDSQDACVSALSRSPQHWSSYSGYMRDVPQLCFAFRKWLEVDAAHAIQRNMSMEALNLLRLLHNKEKMEVARRSAMQREVNALGLIKQDLHLSLVKLQEATHRAISKTENALTQLVKQHLDTLEGLNRELFARLQHGNELITRELEVSVSAATQHLNIILGALEAAEDRTKQSHQLFIQQQESAISALNLLDAKWQAFSLRWLPLQEAVDATLSSTLRVSSELDIQYEKLTNQERFIDQSSRSMQALSTSLEQLVNLAEDRLVAINSTAWDIQNSLYAFGTSSWITRLGKDVLLGGLQELNAPARVIYYLLPSLWYVARVARILWAFMGVTGRNIRALLVILSIVWKTILPTSFDFRMWSGSRRSAKASLSGRLDSRTEKKPSPLAAANVPRRLEFVELPTVTSHQWYPAQTNRGVYRSTSLPPMLGADRPSGVSR